MDPIARGLAANALSSQNAYQYASLRRRLAARPNGVPLRAATLGNSIVAGVSGISFTDEALNRGAGYVNWLSNGGVAGDTSQQMYARIATAVPSNAEVCFVMEGSNDASLTNPVTAFRTYQELIIQWLLARNITPVLIVPPPVSNEIPVIGGIVGAIQALALKYGVDVYDPWLNSVDTSTGSWVSGHNVDNVHPTYTWAKDASDQLVSWINGSTSNTPLSPRSNAAGQSGYCLLTGGNNFILTDTNSDGIADGWSAQGISGVATASITTAPTGFRGNFQRLTSTGGGGGTFSNLNLGVSSGGNAGDDILITFAMEAGGLSNTTGDVVRMSVSNGPITGNQIIATFNLPVTAQRMAYRFTKAQTGNLVFFIEANNAGVNNYLGVGEIEFYNLTALLTS